MKNHPCLILAAVFLFADGNLLIAQTVISPVDVLAQKLREDPEEQAKGGQRLVDFLLKPDSDAKSFVSGEADHAVLDALARDWGRTADAKRLAVLLVVSTPKTRTEIRLRAMLADWTGVAQIKNKSESHRARDFFMDAADKAAEHMEDRRVSGEIEEAILANDQTVVEVPESARAGTERAEKVRARGSRLSFGADRTVQDSALGSIPGAAPGSAPVGSAAGNGDRRTPEQMAALIADLNAAHREGRDRQKITVPSGDIPVPVLHALGSADVAPKSSLMDDAKSLATNDAPTVAADLKQIRGSLQEAVPASVQGLTDSNTNAVNEFFQWLRAANASDMPTIDYTTLPKGEVGRYTPGLGLSKGTIKVNHFIRNAPDDARASVVVHELYHYWDNKVARTYYPNVGYGGKIDPSSMPIHEYDAYLATALYWEMVKKEGASSPLAKMLDRIPTEPKQVQELVDGAVGGRQ
ncbi:MAG: hypothetical protein ABL955_04795 [Elusimicrobiota bacterium]